MSLRSGRRWTNTSNPRILVAVNSGEFLAVRNARYFLFVEFVFTIFVSGGVVFYGLLANEPMLVVVDYNGRLKSVC